MFDKVKTVIDEWDPIQLLSTHCPSDEYDEISMELSQIFGLQCRQRIFRKGDI